MEIKYKNIVFKFDFLFLLVFVLSIISKNMFSIFACYLINYFFIILHELSHCLVAKIFSVKIKKVNIMLSGLFVNPDNFNSINNYKKVIILIAGPLCNLALFFILKKYYILSYINLFLFFINLLPLKNFDGYNILKLFFNNYLLNLICNFIFFILFIFNIILILKYKIYFLTIILIYYYIENAKKYL